MVCVQCWEQLTTWPIQRIPLVLLRRWFWNFSRCLLKCRCFSTNISITIRCLTIIYVSSLRTITQEYYEITHTVRVSSLNGNEGCKTWFTPANMARCPVKKMKFHQFSRLFASISINLSTICFLKRNLYVSHYHTMQCHPHTRELTGWGVNRW